MIEAFNNVSHAEANSAPDMTGSLRADSRNSYHMREVLRIDAAPLAAVNASLVLTLGLMQRR